MANFRLYGNWYYCEEDKCKHLEEKFLDWNNLTHMAILRDKFKSLDFRAHCNILQISVQNYNYKQIILKNV